MWVGYVSPSEVTSWKASFHLNRTIMKKSLQLLLFFTVWLCLYGALQAQYRHDVIDAVGSDAISPRRGEAIIRARNGDLIVCGRYDSTKAFVARYNEWGLEAWIRTFQFGQNATLLLDIAEGADGRLVAVGSCHNCVALNEDVGMILPLDSNGNMTTSNPIIPDSIAGTFTAIAHTEQDDGFITTHVLAVAFHERGYVTKLDATLNETWQYECNAFGARTRLDAVLAIPGLGYFVGGAGTEGFVEERLGIWRLDSQGSLVWYREILPTYTSDARNNVFALAIDSSGRLIAGGSYNLGGTNANEYAIFRMQTSNGSTIDSLIWGGPGLEEIRSIAVTANGDLLAVGFQDAGTFVNSLTGGDAVWFRLSGQLTILESRVFDDPGMPGDHWVMEDVVVVAPDTCNKPGYAACGYRAGAFLQQRLLWTASCVVGIDEREPIHPWLVYPNPAAPQQIVIIELDTVLTAAAYLDMYTMEGRLIGRRRIQAGQMAIELEAPISTGVYLLRLTSGNRSWLHKLVVQ